MLRSLSAKACPTLRNVGVLKGRTIEKSSPYFDEFSLSQRRHRAPVNPLGPEASYQLLSTGISDCALPQHVVPTKHCLSAIKKTVELRQLSPPIRRRLNVLQAIQYRCYRVWLECQGLSHPSHSHCTRFQTSCNRATQPQT